MVVVYKLQIEVEDVFIVDYVAFKIKFKSADILHFEKMLKCYHNIALRCFGEIFHIFDNAFFLRLPMFSGWIEALFRSIVY
jgi:hypothetical protein